MGRLRLILSGLTRTVRELRTLPLGDWCLFTRAWWEVVFVRVGLGLGPLRRRLLAAPGAGTDRPCPVPPSPQLLDVFAAAVRSQPVPPLCLPRSLALSRLLLSRGVPTRLCLGLRKNGGDLEGHAWLDWDAGIVAEPDTLVRQLVRLEWGGQPAPSQRMREA